MKCLFYNTFILSKIDYCLNIWGSSSKCNLECILKLQKRAARIILSANIETRSDIMFKKLDDCLPVSFLSELYLNIQGYKCNEPKLF